MSTLWLLHYLEQCGHIHHTKILACLPKNPHQHDIIHSQSTHSHNGRGSVERILLSPRGRGACNIFNTRPQYMPRSSELYLQNSIHYCRRHCGRFPVTSQSTREAPVVMDKRWPGTTFVQCSITWLYNKY